MVDLYVQIPCSDWPDEEENWEDLITSAVIATLARSDQTLDAASELSVVLADDDTIRALNRDYRHQDKPTNVLAFPAAQAAAGSQPPILGDVILSYGVVSGEAAEQDKSLRAHVQHLVVHGLLHLLGYDHHTAEDAQAMEGLEVDILRQLNVADPYQETRVEACSHG